MSWLVMLGAVLMGMGILLILLPRKRAGSAARVTGIPAAPSTPAAADHPWSAVDPDQTTVMEPIPLPYAAGDGRRPLGAIPAGWCPPPPIDDPYFAAARPWTQDGQPPPTPRW